MADGNGAAPALTQETFHTAFASLQPMIAAEWPVVDSESLAATGGDLERVVALVAEQTERTRTLVLRHLEELHLGLRANEPKVKAGKQVKEMIDRLEKKTLDLVKELRGVGLESTKQKVRQNLLVSLLVAVGLGFLAGIIFGGFGRGK